MSRCDWCESQIGVKRVFCADRRLGETNLCIVCQACTPKMSEVSTTPSMSTTFIDPPAYNRISNPIPLVNWLIPRILD